MGTHVTTSPIACNSSQSKPGKKEKSDISTHVRRNKQYLPAWRSGAYAILLTLLEESQRPDYPGYLTRLQLQTMAQPLCDTSFRKSDSGSFYTAWSSMAGLVKRGLVLRNGSPAKFSLSDAGAAMAQQLRDGSDACVSKHLAAPEIISIDTSDDDSPISETQDGTVAGNGDVATTLMCDNKQCLTVSAPIPMKRKATAANMRDYENSHLSSVQSEKTSHRKKCSPQEQETADNTLILEPGSFDVILLVDKNETAGGSEPRRLLEDVAVSELSALGTLFELRHLKVADFTWVCRDRVTGQELVLPYIVERKRMDDLASSIRDGRFHEQKFRMKQSGLQNLIYLVESHGDNMHTSLPLDTLNQATINTQVVDRFTVKTTSSHRDSMRYLSIMTRLLSSTYCNKTIVSCHHDRLPRCHIRDDLVSLMTFSEFNMASSKTKALKVQDVFIKQLLQLHGLSAEKAQAIVERYPTPRVLMAAFQAEGSAGEKLLANIRYGSLNRLIGPVISRTIHKFYTNHLLS
ncbi:crossover junction endonuclease MUS81 isoform X3 [Cryptotermes secundus]|nr:crossover junction endonuclease MUS81 isoform X3 [Cryptotermes secundus]